MKSNELNVTGKVDRKRKGRGISAGQGKTAGRGTKGQNSRSGGRRRPGFEGGQTPLFMRIPKNRGFTSRHNAQTLTLKQLSRHSGDTVTLKSLIEQEIVDANCDKVKVVATGEVSGAFKLDASVRATASAAEAIKKAGGSVAG